jgi:hypothetical protein
MKDQRAKVVAECTLKESAAINQILGELRLKQGRVKFSANGTFSHGTLSFLFRFLFIFVLLADTCFLLFVVL